MGIPVFTRQTALPVAALYFLLFSFACGGTATLTPAVAATDTPVPSDSPAPTLTASPTRTPTATPGKCTAAPDDLVGWWPGDGNARDLAAGNDGVLNGGSGFANGKVGQAFSFDGIHGSVDVPRVASLNPGRQVSIEFWMKPAPDNTMSSCCQGLVGTDYYLMEISGGWSNSIGVNFAINTGNKFTHTSDENDAAFKVPAGEWSFIVGTYDGQSLRLYINGKEELQLSHQGRMMPMPVNGFLSIGSEDGRTQCSNCNGRYFKGLIDEVSIYNRALTGDEILAIFLADSAGKCPPSP